MFRLVFDHSRIPRTTTRKEWREIDRWRRITERQVKKAVAEEHELLRRNLDMLPPETRARMIDRMINPPLMVYPELP